ncbi:hypothetical protein ABK040_011789 [Willaertia magna]
MLQDQQQQQENNELDLSCPISKDLLEDPIVVPCCGRAFSRQSLLDYFSFHNENFNENSDENFNERSCPCCRGTLTNFNIEQAPKNVNLSSLVETFKLQVIPPQTVQQTVQKEKEEENKAIFKAEVEHLINVDDVDIGVAEMKIMVDDSTLNPKPTLFIVLADVSGSMSGRPWNQVCSSLKHIANQSFENPSVICRMVVYDSKAKEIDMSGNNLSIIMNRIDNAYTGGGTDFACAFKMACDIITRESCLNNNHNLNKKNSGSGDNSILLKTPEELPFGNVVICFLTDGEDFSCVGKEGGCEYLQQEIDKVYRGEYCIHTVGFGTNHNLQLLDSIRKVGTFEGAYRYANYDDNDDVICGKLTSIFDTVSSSSIITAEIILPEGLSFINNNVNNNVNNGSNVNNNGGNVNGGDNNSMIVHIPVNSSGKGYLTRYVKCVPECEKTLQAVLKINGKVDSVILEINQSRCPQRLRLRSLQKLASHHVDELASKTLQLSNVNRTTYGEDLFLFHCELLIRCATSLQGVEPMLNDKLTVIIAEITKLKSGVAVNKNVLNDLKFSSMFTKNNTEIVTEEKNNKKQRNRTIQPPKFKSDLGSGNGNGGGSSMYNIPKIHYVHGKKEYTKLHTAVVQIKNCDFEKYIEDCLSLIDVKDRDGNTPLHLACMKGNLFTIQLLVSLGANLNLTNNDNYTPLDLAICGGFDRSVNFLLQQQQAMIGADKNFLMKYLLDRHFFRTATLLLQNNICSITYEVRSFVDGISYNWIEQFESASASDDMLDLAIRKCNEELFDKCIQSGIIPQVYHLHLAMDYGCLNIFKKLVKSRSQQQLDAIVEYEGKYESLLFSAASSGKNDYLKVLLEAGANKEWRNENGNTPLWIATCNNRIDVVETLLESGADPNTRNNDGVVPLISCAQRNLIEIAEILINYGAEVNTPNKNGDNPLIISCRTGQHEILELFLSKATEEDLQYCAKIDGFNCVFSAAEQDRADCILVLNRYGASIKCRTRPDNQIIPYSTPLHLTALYGGVNAAKVLLDLGADIEAEDLNGMTSLHIAMLRGNLNVVKLLLSRGANMFAIDNAGNMPGAYCQDINPDLLVDVLYPYLIKIARGEFGLLECKYIEILRNYSFLPGFLQSSQITNLRGLTAGCALIEAVIYNNLNAAKVLVELGASASIKDQNEMTARDWAEIVGGMMKSVIPGTPNLEIMNRLNLIVGKDKQLVTLIGKPTTITTNATFEVKVPAIDDFSEIEKNQEIIDPLKIFEHPKWLGGKIVFQKEMFEIKREIIGKVASGSKISPRKLAILYLIAGNTCAINIFNQSPQSLQQEENDENIIPKFDGECFVIEAKVDRSKFLIGSDICWNRFMVFHSNWSIPKQGTLFLVKSKNGVRVGQKVVFGTNSKFKVTAWYKADSTCIAQKNIRQSCFGIQDFHKYVSNDSPIIIELTEE